MISNDTTWSGPLWTVHIRTSSTDTTATAGSNLVWRAPAAITRQSSLARMIDRFVETARAVAVYRWAALAAALTGLERALPPALARLVARRPRTCALSSSWRARAPPC